MATSAIPAFKKALFDALTALAAGGSLQGVIVSYGIPYPASPEFELIVLGDVPQWNQDAAAMRNPGHPREEEFGLEVFIRVQKNGADQQRAATERAFVLAGIIENYLRTNVTVGGTVRVAQFDPSGGQLEEFPTENARLALLTAYVVCNARI